MIHGVPEIIAVLSQYVALAAGDLIFTGTPAGVGRLNPGDRLDGEISGVGRVNLTIGN
jgi:fumarylpyruvate hydrolase